MFEVMGCNFTLAVVLYLISGKIWGILLGVSFADANTTCQTGSMDASWRKQEVVRVLRPDAAAVQSVLSTNQPLFKYGELICSAFSRLPKKTAPIYFSKIHFYLLFNTPNSYFSYFPTLTVANVFF